MLAWAKQWLNAPTEDAASVRQVKAWLAGLPANDPPRALALLTEQIAEVLAAESRPTQAFEAIRLLDEGSIGFRNRLAREYLTQSRLASYRESLLWSGVHGFWSQLARAHVELLDRAQQHKNLGWSHEVLGFFVVRALAAMKTWIKWRLVRYAEVDCMAWHEAARFLLLAKNNELFDAPLPLYSGVSSATSARSEWLKLVLLAVAAPDALMPVETEIASRLTDYLASHAVWRENWSEDTPFCFDLAGQKPPMRVQGGGELLGVWGYFGIGHALELLERIDRAAQTGMLPEGVPLGGEYPPRLIARVSAHLLRYWGKNAPARRYPRRAVFRRVEVLHGYSEVIRHFAGLPILADEPQENESIEIQALMPPRSPMPVAESWVIQNLSRGGLGAVVGRVSGDWLGVGRLLAFSLSGDEGAWGVGVIRRLHRTGHGEIYVGVERLSNDVAAIKIRLPELTSGDEEYALLLDGERLLGRVGVLTSSGRVEVAQPEGHWLPVSITELNEQTETFDLARVVLGH